MFTRLSRPAEAAQLDLIRSVAFETPWEPPKPDAENRPSTMEWWVAGEGDELFATIGVLPYAGRFDGREVLMAGIGGVATLPQHRRKGAIRACMTAALAEMRRRGAMFSTLYPFSRAYYRKFGYGDGPSVSVWTIPFSALSLPDVGGSIEMVRPDGDFGPVREVYATCAANWNLSMVNSRLLDELSEQSWMKACRYLYLWRDEAGAPAGMMLFTKVDGVMDCRTEFGKPNCMLFRDGRALAGLLNFAKGFAADYDAIRFAVPQGVRVQGLIAEGNAAKCEVHYNCMARLVNVPAALEACKAHGEGSVVISVMDELLSENAGAWKVGFGAGGNRVEKVEGTADIELTVNDLTQLVLGACCADDLPMMPNAKLLNPSAPFSSLFPRKPCHLLDLF